MSKRWQKKIKKNRFHAKQIKESALCEVCLLKRKTLEWHHRNAQTKFQDVSSLLSKRTTFGKLKKEIAKCDLICTECHIGVHQWWAVFKFVEKHDLESNLRILYYALTRYKEWKS